jgi:hypothetical protein
MYTKVLQACPLAMPTLPSKDTSSIHAREHAAQRSARLADFINTLVMGKDGGHLMHPGLYGSPADSFRSPRYDLASERNHQIVRSLMHTLVKKTGWDFSDVTLPESLDP